MPDVPKGKTFVGSGSGARMNGMRVARPQDA